MGALTLKVFSNELREWELIEGEAFDPTDGFGVNLRLSLRENQIYLAEPNDPDAPWITDKARLFFDGMFSENTNKQTIVWESFFKNFFDFLYFIDHLNFHKKKKLSLTFIIENLSLEILSILYLLKQTNYLIKIRKVETCNIRNDLELNYQINNSVQKSELFKSTLALVLNCNPRYEGYLLNLHLRQRFLKGNFKVLSIGSLLNLTFSTSNLGSNFSVLKQIAEGTHIVCQDFKTSDSPLLVTNTEFLKRKDSKLLYNNLQTPRNSILQTPINVLNSNLSSVGINTLSKFLPLSSKDFENSFGFYFINVSMESDPNIKRFVELHLLKLLSIKTNAIINDGIPKIFVDQRVDFINVDFVKKFKNKLFNDYYYLPNNLFLEDSETFINTQAIVKRTTKMLSFKKNAKSNWQIIRKIYLKTKSTNFFNQLKDSNFVSFDAKNLNNFKNYLAFHFYTTQTFSNFSFYLKKQNNPYFDSKFQLNAIKKPKTKMFETKLKNWLDDFFTRNGKDSFSYNSSVLINCSKITRTSSTNFF